MYTSPEQAVDIVDGWRLPDPRWSLDPTDPDADDVPPTGMEDVGVRLYVSEPSLIATPYQRLLMGLYVDPAQVAGPSRAAFLAACAFPEDGSPALDLTRPTPGSRSRFFFVCRFFLAFKNGLQQGLPPNDAFQLAKGWLFALLGP